MKIIIILISFIVFTILINGYWFLFKYFCKSKKQKEVEEEI